MMVGEEPVVGRQQEALTALSGIKVALQRAAQ